MHPIPSTQAHRDATAHSDARCLLAILGNDPPPTKPPVPPERDPDEDDDDEVPETPPTDPPPIPVKDPPPAGNPEGPFVVEDKDGTIRDAAGGRWRVTTTALVSETGDRLLAVPAHRAFWFGWFAQHPDTEVYR